MNEELNNELVPDETTETPEVVEDNAQVPVEEIPAPAVPVIPEKSAKSRKGKKQAKTDDSDNVPPSQDEKKKRKLPVAWRVVFIVLGSLLTLVLIAVLVAWLYLGGKLKMIGRESNWKKPNQDQIDSFLAEQTESVPDDANVVDPNEIQWGDVPNPLETSDGVINILLIGQDRRPGEEIARSDSMILCTLNKHNNTLTMTSFMRDMYVQIPGYNDNRINVSYFLGGMELLNETLEVNFGVQVDANVEVDMEGFAQCIDLIGGVDVELTQAEINFMNNKYLRENPGATPWSLTPGVNHLNGVQALTHARDRYTGNGDYDRTARQRKILNAVYNKAKTMSITQINALLNQLLPNLTTDMTDKEILGYTWAVVSLFDKLEVKQQRIPADGTYYDAWISSMAVLVPDLESNRQVLAEIMKAE